MDVDFTKKTKTRRLHTNNLIMKNQNQIEISKSTQKKLLAAWEYCDEHDKSTEYMLAYMQDMSSVSLDTVLFFIENYESDENLNE